MTDSVLTAQKVLMKWPALYNLVSLDSSKKHNSERYQLIGSTTPFHAYFMYHQLNKKAKTPKKTVLEISDLSDVKISEIGSLSDLVFGGVPSFSVGINLHKKSRLDNIKKTLVKSRTHLQQVLTEIKPMQKYLAEIENGNLAEDYLAMYETVTIDFALDNGYLVPQLAIKKRR